MEITIGANIKRLRVTKNVTQEQLAEAMNVTPAAVSKWERGETYPDITLLQPLAYYFGVTLDDLMGYDEKKVQAEIEEIKTQVKKRFAEGKSARDVIFDAYRRYPNDYWIMHWYMWDLAGGSADNDPALLLSHKDEFLSICDKILKGCTDEGIRLEAWNMRAKILYAEGKTDEALEIYRTKFGNWYITSGQKTEQLFPKDTAEYYFYMRKNMYELAGFAADKLGRTVFFDPSLSTEEKTERALRYGELLRSTYDETGESFFLVIASDFLGRMENDLLYRGGSDKQIAAVMDPHLSALKELQARCETDEALNRSFDRFLWDERGDMFEWNLNYRTNPVRGRRAELLKSPAYAAVLKKYE